ncbi:MAG: hypothetical protein OXC30_03535 [Alphaproteobacteria bacterium]|nr:hypothetical protein [Alphaproteobacteria bacterium]
MMSESSFERLSATKVKGPGQTCCKNGLTACGMRTSDSASSKEDTMMGSGCVDGLCLML